MSSTFSLGPKARRARSKPNASSVAVILHALPSFWKAHGKFSGVTLTANQGESHMLTTPLALGCGTSRLLPPRSLPYGRPLAKLLSSSDVATHVDSDASEVSSFSDTPGSPGRTEAAASRSAGRALLRRHTKEQGTGDQSPAHRRQMPPPQTFLELLHLDRAVSEQPGVPANQPLCS